MTLLEAYALECGVKPPEKSHDFPSNFHPLPERYITISAKSGQSAKDYNYFDIVVSLVAPYLIREKIGILQLGLPDENQIPGTFKPNMTLRQTAHAIKSSLAHVTVDTMSNHLAGGYGTPIVAVFGSTAAANTAPFFSGKHIYLEGYKTLPSYQAEESIKAINSIKPETIAQAILDILEIPEKILLKTIYIGSRYNQQSIELIPNFRPDYSKFPNLPINVRMDICHNEQILLELVQHYPGTLIVTLNKPLSLNFPRNKFSQINYFFGADYVKEDLMKVKWEVPTTFIYTGRREDINKVRMDLESPFEFGFIHLLSDPPSIDGLSEMCRMNTQKIVISGGQSYSSIYHAKTGIPGTGGVLVGKSINSFDWQSSIENFYIYTK